MTWNKMMLFKDLLYNGQGQTYSHFTDEKTKAWNLTLLTPNPVLLQGHRSQNNLTTIFSINSPAFMEKFNVYGQKDLRSLAQKTQEIIRRYRYKA